MLEQNIRVVARPLGEQSHLLFVGRPEVAEEIHHWPARCPPGLEHHRALPSACGREATRAIGRPRGGLAADASDLIKLIKVLERTQLRVGALDACGGAPDARWCEPRGELMHSSTRVRGGGAGLG